MNIIYIYMGGVQDSRSQGLYAVRRIGIEQLIELHLRYEAGPNRKSRTSGWSIEQ